MQLQRGYINYLMAGICLAACLFMVWYPAYFVTGDGPCHLYNARMLHDLWFKKKDISFFLTFYEQNRELNPNWASHMLLATLMTVFQPEVSEKILVSLYLLTMAGGLYVLLHRISGTTRTSYWAISAFLLVFNHCLFKGFYNFTLGVALAPWLLLAWLRVLANSNFRTLFTFFLLSAATFFTQLLPYVVAILACGLATCSWHLPLQGPGKGPELRAFLKKLITLALLSGPYAYLMFAFTGRMGGLHLTLWPHLFRLWDLVTLRYLICLVPGERFYLGLAALALYTLLGVAIWERIKAGAKVHRWDGLWVALLLSLAIYTCFPEDFMGRAILISMRMQLFVVIFALLCIGVWAPYFHQNAGGFVLFFCFAGLSLQRMPAMNSASVVASRVVAACQRIQPNSTVLPLLATELLHKEGKVIASENYLFSHITDYVGTNQPVILLDNYEANTGYFPFNWRSSHNPYLHLQLSAGNGTQLSCADILTYTSFTKQEVNYVLLIGDDNGSITPCKQVKLLLDSAYTLTDSAPGVALWMRKK
ncbi:MAG: hypothetical protein EBZ77_05115 [Chitinophagia bacterium]|nr:hypothetical protein [Chitinophagia bacterium]